MPQPLQYGAYYHIYNRGNNRENLFKFIAYAKAINKAAGRTGVLFETPFHRKLIESDAYFKQLVVYIHQNPQKHGFVEDFRDWRWSSYGALLSNMATHLDRSTVMDWFGDPTGLVDFHQQTINIAKVEEIVAEEEYAD